ncbi:MAG: FMN-binding protein [Planctomycetota bacterium]
MRTAFLAALLLLAAPAERVHLTADEALALAFPGAKIERSRAFLTPEERQRAAALAGSEIEGGLVIPYTARDAAGKLLGTAYFDVHRVRTLRETILIAIGPDERIRRIELLSFGEPPEYTPPPKWYGEFVGRKLDDDLRLGRGIRGISGATLTARATTDAVRQVLAVHRVLTARPPGGAGGRGGGGAPAPAGGRR